MILETPRLRIREMSAADAPFMLALLNDPAFIRNVADRGVRTLEAARDYIAAGPMASHAQYGFGLCLVELIEDGAPIGICGLLKRDELPEPDIGFAFLPPYRSRGYAREAADAVLAYGRDRLGLTRLLAIVNPSNEPSIRLLERLGFSYQSMVRLTPASPELKLFASNVESPCRG
jgi:RimJ/RimL family protein N-acetyltransferase